MKIHTWIDLQSYQWLEGILLLDPYQLWEDAFYLLLWQLQHVAWLRHRLLFRQWYYSIGWPKKIINIVMGFFTRKPVVGWGSRWQTLKWRNYEWWKNNSIWDRDRLELELGHICLDHYSYMMTYNDNLHRFLTGVPKNTKKWTIKRQITVEFELFPDKSGVWMISWVINWPISVKILVLFKLVASLFLWAFSKKFEIALAAGSALEVSVMKQLIELCPLQ